MKLLPIFGGETVAPESTISTGCFMSTENFVDDLCLGLERELMSGDEDNVHEKYRIYGTALEDYKAAQRKHSLLPDYEDYDDCDDTTTCFDSTSSSTHCDSRISCTESCNSEETSIMVNICSNDKDDEIEVVNVPAVAKELALLSEMEFYQFETVVEEHNSTSVDDEQDKEPATTDASVIVTVVSKTLLPLEDATSEIVPSITVEGNGTELPPASDSSRKMEDETSPLNEPLSTKEIRRGDSRPGKVIVKILKKYAALAKSHYSKQKTEQTDSAEEIRGDESRPGKVILKKLKKSAKSAKSQYSKQKTKLSSLLGARNGPIAAKGHSTKAIEEVLKHRKAAYMWSLSVIKHNEEIEEGQQQRNEDPLSNVHINTEVMVEPSDVDSAPSIVPVSVTVPSKKGLINWRKRKDVVSKLIRLKKRWVNGSNYHQ